MTKSEGFSVTVSPEECLYLDGMTIPEFNAMMDDPNECERYVAQKAPTSYIVGLKIGSMWARTESLKVEDFDDWCKFTAQLDQLTVEACDCMCEEVWAAAETYGKRAGRQLPIKEFEIQGAGV